MDSNVQKIDDSEVIVEYKPIPITYEFLKQRPLSYSSLKAFRKSPKHYMQYITEPRVEKEAYVEGNVVECLLLEEDKFNQKFQIYNKFPKQSNDAKAKWKEMTETAKANKITLVDSETMVQANLMVNSVKSNPQTAYYLDRIALKSDGTKRIQEKLQWVDKLTGLPIIGYVDFMVDIDGHLVIVDIKTTVDGDPDTFMRQAGNLGYDIQVGCYLTGFHKTKFLFPDFMFMVIEKSMPYNCQMHYCDSKYCNNAKDEFKQTLVAFKYCMDNNLFYQGYEFWLFDTMPYFTMQKPGYIKSKFAIQ